MTTLLYALADPVLPAPPEAVTYWPLGSYLWVRLCAPEDRTPGGLWLPEESQHNATDAVVMDLGPNACCEPGDRVIFPPWALRTTEDREGFVRERDCVAVLPGPLHEDLQALNDYVLVRPDPLPERHGRLYVPSYALPGQKARTLKRGEELHREFTEMLLRPEWQEMPKWEAIPKFRRIFYALPADEQEAVLDAAQNKGKTGWQFVRNFQARPVPTHGLLLGTSERVHWSAAHDLVMLRDGERTIGALKRECLLAVEEV